MKAKTRAKTKSAAKLALLRQRAIKYQPIAGREIEFDVIPVLPLRTAEDLLTYVEHLKDWAGIGSAIAELGKDDEALPAVILWDIAKGLDVVSQALEKATVPELCHDSAEYRGALIKVVRESLIRNNVVADVGISERPAAVVLGVVLDSLGPTSSLAGSA